MVQGLRSGELSRRLLVGSAGLFVTSCLFPVAASLLRGVRLPGWIGIADVVVAAVLILVVMAIVAKQPSPFAGSVVASGFRAYRSLANGFLVLLVLFFVAGDSINWNILLPGLAWRAWLLVLVLPSWLSGWHTGDRSVENQG